MTQMTSTSWVEETATVTNANNFKFRTLSPQSQSCNMQDCVICESLAQQLEFKQNLLVAERLKNRVLKKKKGRAQHKWRKLERYTSSLEKELAELRNDTFIPIDEDLESLLSTYGLRDALLERVQEVIQEWDDNIMNQVNADVFIANILERNRTLENIAAGLSVRNENLRMIVNNLKHDKKRLIREVLIGIIPFTYATPPAEAEEILDALTWHCWENNADVIKVAEHFELYLENKSVDNELDDIMEAYRLCKTK
jgi:hypothetical protein